MKKYIAPELEVELYALDASIAAGCAIASGNNPSQDVACIVSDNQSLFTADGNAYSDGTGVRGGSLGNDMYKTPNFGNPGVSQANGSCDCYYSAYGINLLATS